MVGLRGVVLTLTTFTLDEKRSREQPVNVMAANRKSRAIFFMVTENPPVE
jgi:hypothetical protein